MEQDITTGSNDGITQYDAMAEICATLAELAQMVKIETATACHWAVQALELLTLAVEEYEDGA